MARDLLSRPDGGHPDVFDQGESMRADQRIRVASLRVRGTAHDSPRLRQGVRGLVAGADLHPAGLPPAAILIVRELEDPLMSEVGPGPGAGRFGVPYPRSNELWRQAARATVEDRFRAAVRPAGAVSAPNAAAVLFADEAELVAALAHDLAIRRARERWWWTVILQDLASPRPLAQLLEQRGRIVPAVMWQLSVWGQVAVVLANLEPREATQIEDAMLRAWDLPSLAPTSRQPPIQDDGAGSAIGDVTPRARPSAATHREGPWSPWVPPSAVPITLDPTRRDLLGVGLLLHLAPAVAGTERFAEALAGWRVHERSSVGASRGDGTRSDGSSAGRRMRVDSGRYEGAGDGDGDGVRGGRDGSCPDGSPALSGDGSATPGDGVPAPGEHVGPFTGAPAGADPPDPDDGVAMAPPGFEGQPSRGHARPIDAAPVLTGTTEHRPDAGRSPAERSSPTPGLPSAPASKAAFYPPSPSASSAPASERSSRGRLVPAGATAQRSEGHGAVTTQLGGVLFLVNVVRRLELPDLAEPDWGLASEIGGWGIVDLLGRLLMDGDEAWLPNDGIWAVLATLAGRPPDTLPSLPRPGPNRFVLPPSWHRESRVGVTPDWCWGGERGLLRVWSERGYVVGEELNGGDATRGQAQRLLGLHTGRRGENLRREPLGFAPVAATDLPLLRGLDPHIARWLRLVGPFVRWRLARAIEPADVAADGVGALLRRDAQVHITSTHVDMVLRMDDTTLPARVAGLDLDPGWVPELGRAIRFIYE